MEGECLHAAHLFPNAWDNGNGYWRLSLGGKRYYAHRLHYELMHGALLDRLVVDHRCRNRWCVNIDHLRATTNKINTEIGESPPARNARKTRCSAGHEYSGQADGTRRCMTCRQLSRKDTKRLGVGRAGDRQHCPKGHPYNEENTYLIKRADGSIKQRTCRECGRQRVRARRAAKNGGGASVRNECS